MVTYKSLVMLFELVPHGNRYSVTSKPKVPEFNMNVISSNDTVFVRTAYQKIYLPQEKRYDPRRWIDDTLLKKYYESEVKPQSNEHPVGSVFNVLVYQNGMVIEDYPAYSMLNSATDDIKQDHFDTTTAFFNCLNISLKGMLAFNFFNRYNVVKEEFIASVVTAYRK